VLLHDAVALTLSALVAAGGGAGARGDGRVAHTGGGSMAPRTAGELSVTILDAPEPGIPIEVRLSSDDVELIDNRLGWADVVDPQAHQPRVRARFVAPAASGRHRVRGLVTWVTCDGDACRTRRAPIAWTIDVPP
jgi:hypothetical protein